MIHVVRYESPDAWADGVAARFTAFLSARPTARLCLPTGLTPLPLYDRIAERVRTGAVSFARAHVFLLDEFGGVAPDAAGRCDVTLRRALIDRVDLPSGQYHRPIPEAPDLEAMCREYEAAMGGPLDLCVLGLGTNGHIGMNEPGSAVDSPTRRVELAPETTRAAARYFADGPLPTWGVTIGLGQLLASRAVWLLASGAAKAEIVRAILLEPVSANRPASLLRGHPACTLFVDADAASLLPPWLGR